MTMKPELEKLCTEFITNRDIVKEAFKGDNSTINSICANLFCACGRTADADHLKECSKIISERTGFFSKFRGQLRCVLSCMLALGDNPEEQMLLAAEYYDLLKQNFKNTEYLALTAFLLTESGDKSLAAEKIVRGKELFHLMNKEHPYLTDDTDSVFAVLLAFSEKTDYDLIQDIEVCYKCLKTVFSHSDDVQTAAQILAMSDGVPEEKAQRMIDLYNALLEAGIKYGHSSELAPLTALSLADTPIPTLVEEIKEVDEFLKIQKDYTSKDIEQEQRTVHAVMIVSNRYAVTKQVNSSVMTTTLDALIAKRRAMYISLVSQTVIELTAQILTASLDEKKEKSGEGTSEANNK